MDLDHDNPYEQGATVIQFRRREEGASDLCIGRGNYAPVVHNAEEKTTTFPRKVPSRPYGGDAA